MRPLILHEKKVVDVEPEDVREGFPLSPMVCVFILIGVTCFVGWLQSVSYTHQMCIRDRDKTGTCFFDFS